MKKTKMKMKMKMKMKKNSCIFIFLVFLFLFFSHVASKATGGGGGGGGGGKDMEVEDEKEFDYDERSKKGPTKWSSLNKEWKACNSGGMQSPVDMSDHKVRRKGRNFISRRDYKSANATLKNRGHDISLQWVVGEAGSIKINGTKFFLQQAHWHSPSEHSINGRRYDMELHLVHVNLNSKVKKKTKKKNRIAVIGVLYKIGRADPFLSKLMKYIPSMSDKKVNRSIGLVDPKRIKLKGYNKVYRYMGSLTIPPCTEGVIWTIIKKVKSVSKAQVAFLREAVHDNARNNARPIQQLNDREIYSSS